MSFTFLNTGISKIPDLIVAVLWGLIAVLAVVLCFFAKSKKTVLGLSLVALVGISRVVAEVFSDEIKTNKLTEVVMLVLGAIIAVASIIAVIAKNRFNRTLWLTFSIVLLVLQVCFLAILPFCAYTAQPTIQNIAKITTTVLLYVIPAFALAMLFAIFFKCVLKKAKPVDDTENSLAVEQNPHIDATKSIKYNTDTNISQNAKDTTSKNDEDATASQNDEETTSKSDEVKNYGLAVDEQSQNSNSTDVETNISAFSHEGNVPVPKKRLLYCKYCGFRTESIYRSCPRCSNEMTEVINCPICGTETHGIFCGNCGTRVKK